MIAHVLTFGAHRRTLVCGASPTRESPTSGQATPCTGWPKRSDPLVHETSSLFG
jgi:hypothetical protein